MIRSKGPIHLAANDLFSHFCWRLAGPDLSDEAIAGGQNRLDVFMVSDFGSTVCLPTYGDNDPAMVNPERLYVR